MSRILRHKYTKKTKDQIDTVLNSTADLVVRKHFDGEEFKGVGRYMETLCEVIRSSGGLEDPEIMGMVRKGEAYAIRRYELVERGKAFSKFGSMEKAATTKWYYPYHKERILNRLNSRVVKHLKDIILARATRFCSGSPEATKLLTNIVDASDDDLDKQMALLEEELKQRRG